MVFCPNCGKEIDKKNFYCDVKCFKEHNGFEQSMSVIKCLEIMGKGLISIEGDEI